MLGRRQQHRLEGHLDHVHRQGQEKDGQVDPGIHRGDANHERAEDLRGVESCGPYAVGPSQKFVGLGPKKGQAKTKTALRSPEGGRPEGRGRTKECGPRQTRHGVRHWQDAHRSPHSRTNRRQGRACTVFGAVALPHTPGNEGVGPTTAPCSTSTWRCAPTVRPQATSRGR